MLVISGTNRKGSNTRKIAGYYQELLNKAGQANQLLDLAYLPEDFTATALYENNGLNEEFNAFRDIVERAEKYVFLVPEYNGSFPGIVKAFIDGLRFPDSFKHKKAALVGISSNLQGGSLAMSHLNDIFNYLGMHVLAQRIRIPAIKQNMEGGTLSNDFYKELLENQAKTFIEF